MTKRQVWLSGPFSERMAVILVGTLMVAIFAAIAGLALGVGASRTFIVDATTTSVTITFSGQVNDWALGTVVLCTPRPRIEATQPRGSGPCDARRFVEKTQDDMRIVWNDGARAMLSAIESNLVAVDVSGQVGLPDRSRIIVDRQSLAALGALAFNGVSRIGEQVSSGATKLTLSGSYEARERPLFSSTTEVLRTGQIKRGESVAIMKRVGQSTVPAQVFGHIIFDTPGTPPFLVGLVSTPGNVFLQVAYFGSAVPAEIAPNWVDRTLNSPLLLALVFFLSSAVGAVHFAGTIREWWK